MEFTQSDVNLIALIWLVGWLAIGFYFRKTDGAAGTRKKPTLFFSKRNLKPKAAPRRSRR
jgi:hypothetical protein